MKTTSQLVIAYLNCKYKAYLLTTDIAIEPSNYETFLQSQAEVYAAAATNTLLAPDNIDLVARNKPILVENLKEGAEERSSMQTQERGGVIHKHA